MEEGEEIWDKQGQDPEGCSREGSHDEKEPHEGSGEVLLLMGHSAMASEEQTTYGDEKQVGCQKKIDRIGRIAGEDCDHAGVERSEIIDQDSDDHESHRQPV